MRLLLLALALVPFVVFAARDAKAHVTYRKPGVVENVLHVGLGLAELALVFATFTAKLSWELGALGAVALLGGVDELVFHRELPAAESDLHAKAHFALFVFVAVALGLNHAPVSPWLSTRGA